MSSATRPRAGSPGTFTAEQVTQILAVACERLNNRDGRSMTGLGANWPKKPPRHRRVISASTGRTLSRRV